MLFKTEVGRDPRFKFQAPLPSREKQESVNLESSYLVSESCIYLSVGVVSGALFAPAHGTRLAVLSVRERPREDARVAEHVFVVALPRVLQDQEAGTEGQSQTSRTETDSRATNLKISWSRQPQPESTRQNKFVSNFRVKPFFRRFPSEARPIL